LRRGPPILSMILSQTFHKSSPSIKRFSQNMLLSSAVRRLRVAVGHRCCSGSIDVAVSRLGIGQFTGRSPKHPQVERLRKVGCVILSPLSSGSIGVASALRADDLIDDPAPDRVCGEVWTSHQPSTPPTERLTIYAVATNLTVAYRTPPVRGQDRVHLI